MVKNYIFFIQQIDYFFGKRKGSEEKNKHEAQWYQIENKYKYTYII